MNRKNVLLVIGLLALGVPGSVILSDLRDQGVSDADAALVMKRALSASERAAEPGQPTIRKHRLALLTPLANAADANDLVAGILCADVVDDAPRALACLAAERQTFGIAVRCDKQGVPTHFFAEGTFRDVDSDALKAADQVSPILIVTRADNVPQRFAPCPE